ncbi:DNA polymerase-3 subunit delta [Rubricella aquisinus]|uniref:DNA-directed DNA polymerase n=1 Tax=Rubricella aquisinus TaxID=2028108 RepID=A0A840X297_9RHOB|nr:DNA polymerase III subunit delta [Rubricella aquisinus]MBB5516934.1 DNA polymerase-3 subunit delta [Rubricella aquisinus]
MKLGKREANRFFAKPEPGVAGILIYGPDPMRIALKREQLVRAQIGPQGEEEMRFSRMMGADLRSDKAMLGDAMGARGFFPGPRAVLLEDATDTVAPMVKAALEDWREGDALLIVTAGQLTPRGALRKLFEPAKNAYAAPIYADPPDRDELEEMIRTAGLPALSRPVMEDLTTLSRDLDPGDFAQTLEKLALYTLGQVEVTPDDLAAIMPQSTEAELDEVIAAVARQDARAVAPLMSRMLAQGVNPTTLIIMVSRHFRQMHAVASMGGGEEAMMRLRPPVMGPRKRQMSEQLRLWSVPMLEAAIKTLMDTDLALRSPRPVPDMALIERALVRIAMQSKRR